MHTLITTLRTQKGLTGQLVAYVLVGLSVAGVLFLSFWVVLTLTGLIYIASAIAYAIAFTTSYMLQREVTFATSAERRFATRTAFTLFILSSLAGLLVNLGVVYLALTLMGFNAYVAQFLAVAVVASYNFVLYRFILT